MVIPVGEPKGVSREIPLSEPIMLLFEIKPLVIFPVITIPSEPPVPLPTTVYPSAAKPIKLLDI